MKKIFKLFTLIIVFITASNCCFALSIGKIEKLINNSDLDKTSTIAISIRNAENNNIIYEKNADKLLHPASTLKVPTTYFAINTLGYDYFFKTQFYKDSKNNLYIKLGADPLLKTSQLKEAFQKIKEKNLSTFNNLYIDDSIIDKKEFAPGWMWDDDVNPYTPKISAYNLDENIIKANITQIDDNTMTVSTSSKYPMSIFAYIKKDVKSDYFEISRYNWNNPELVEIYGRTVIPRQISIPISSMRRYFIYNLDKIIDDNRITIQSTMYASNLVPQDAELLYEISNPITPTLISILHKSNNVMAETLFKLAGGQKYNSTGTDELGIYAMIEFYKKLNINFNSVVIKDGSGISRNQILFADVSGDDEATASSFDVYRVMNNPFMWNAVLEEKKWYFDKTNIVVGEVIAYTGLPGAGIDQTRGLIDNISANSHGTEKNKKECQYYKDYFRCRSYNTLNTWVAPVYGTSDVTAPFKYTADVAGVDAGVDVDYGFYNKLGLFVSYRTGSYDFDGTGEEISSDTGSSIDINSYLAGLYYRYERGYLWTMSTIFGGVQNAEMSSDDGVSSDTSGMELGASFEAGLIFNPMTDLFIEPIVGLFYTHIAYDDFTDDYGKKVEYDAVMNLDLEAGIRIEKRFKTDNGYAKFYFKPSVIQSLSSGDVNISELPAMSSTDNRTLTKFEFGGSIDFSDGWNGFGNVSYITGSDYSNVAANVGVNYTW